MASRFVWPATQLLSLICIIGVSESFVPTSTIRGDRIVSSKKLLQLPDLPLSVVRSRNQFILRSANKEEIDDEAVDTEASDADKPPATTDQKKKAKKARAAAWKAKQAKANNNDKSGGDWKKWGGKDSWKKRK